MLKDLKFIFTLLSVLFLSGCYCGFFNSNADCYIDCKAFDDYRLSIDDHIERGQERNTVKLDTISDTLRVAYLLTTSRYQIEMNLSVFNNNVVLDTLESYVTDLASTNQFRFDSFRVNEFELTENQCCAENPEGCSDPSSPGSLVADLESVILCEDGANKKLSLQIGLQTLENESCEC